MVMGRAVISDLLCCFFTWIPYLWLCMLEIFIVFCTFGLVSKPLLLWISTKQTVANRTLPVLGSIIQACSSCSLYWQNSNYLMLQNGGFPTVLSNVAAKSQISLSSVAAKSQISLSSVAAKSQISFKFYVLPVVISCFICLFTLHQ